VAARLPQTQGVALDTVAALARERLVHRPLRLIGLGVSGLHEVQARQLALALDEKRCTTDLH